MLSKKHTLIIFLLIGAISIFGCSQNTPENNSAASTSSNTEEKKDSTSPATATSAETETKFSFKVDFPSLSSKADLISYNDTKHAFVAKDGYEAYNWWLNGSALSNTNGFVVLTDKLINDFSLVTGKNYTIMVIVEDINGELDSNTLEFKLTSIN